MGVPKFYRWLSERYPKINQRLICEPRKETVEKYFTEKEDIYPYSSSVEDEYITIKPEFDRLYLDMNGIIHCCSHNNSFEQVGELDEKESAANNSASAFHVNKKLSDEEIFRNIRYYLDRVISDIIEPQELIYFAIDGVAPRAKMNQQRSRRFRAAKESEIAKKAYILKANSNRSDENSNNGGDGTGMTRNYGDAFMQGTFHVEESTYNTHEENREETSFHSNCITPGTAFLQKCSADIQEFIQEKLQSDPKWSKLTIIFSGSNVPGEGEHKIMDFIRYSKSQATYNPNTRHCLAGQDGDLIMLGLATHEPHFALFREKVHFNKTAVFGDRGEDVQEATKKYIHNVDFEFLHLSILRDYLAYEFDTYIDNSPFLLERTIQDFIFMTFFVGNDFLPHLPALNIGEGAFDLLFSNYKYHRTQYWLKEDKKNPYLIAENGNGIICGKRLEKFLREISSHEVGFYERKKLDENFINDKIRRDDEKYGRIMPTIPSAEILDLKEKQMAGEYREMMQSIEGNSMVEPVLSTSAPMRKEVEFESEEKERSFLERMRIMLTKSLSNKKENDVVELTDEQLNDIKGRYYYDKFQFTPYDTKKHYQLRQDYIKTLIWCLIYYYKGCCSWSWYFPYHYAPMLSDLENIDEMISNVSFELSEPLQPFEQLLACLPPSSAFILPKPFHKIMISEDSPVIDYFPSDFDVDMNGARNPWEAVILLPFIEDSKMKTATKNLVDFDSLTEEEKSRNIVESPKLFKMEGDEIIKVTYQPKYYYHDENDDKLTFISKLAEGTHLFKSGFPSLTTAPIHLVRKLIGINVHGTKSRYKTAVISLNQEYLPPPPPAHSLGKKFVGSTVYYNYPFLQEGFVTAVADEEGIMRGSNGGIPKYTKFNNEESVAFELRIEKIQRDYFLGDGTVGSGGWLTSGNDTISKNNVKKEKNNSIMLFIRPLKGTELHKGNKVKVYAQKEVAVPFNAAIWFPHEADKRFANLPAKLEKNPFSYYSRKDSFLPKKLKSAPFPNSASKSSLAAYHSASKHGNIRRFSSLYHPSLKLYTNHFQLSNFMTNNILSRSQSLNIPCYLKRKELKPIKETFTKLYTNKFNYKSKRKGAIVGMLAIVMANFVPSANSSRNNFLNPVLRTFEESNLFQPIRNEQNEEIAEPPDFQHAHGTTTLAFKCKDGIVAAVDSRATMGNYIGSRTTQKIIPINKYTLGTMAGGAADCMYWIRKIRGIASVHELQYDKPMSPKAISRLLSNSLYNNRNLELSIGTMILGYDFHGNGNIYYVDNTGTRIKGNLFAVGSGSTFALGVLDSYERNLLEMTKEEAIVLAIKALRSATMRDAHSGGYIGVYIITNDGWEKVFSEDLALISNDLKDL